MKGFDLECNAFRLRSRGIFLQALGPAWYFIFLALSQVTLYGVIWDSPKTFYISMAFNVNLVLTAGPGRDIAVPSYTHLLVKIHNLWQGPEEPAPILTFC